MAFLFNLPPDNAPDDTETRAFQNYGEHVAVVSLLNFRQVLMAGAALTALMLFGVGIWYLWPQAEPEYRVVPNRDVFIDISGDPLAQLSTNLNGIATEQVGITVPARVDQSLVANSSRLYAFNAEAGITWRVEVIVSGGFTPTVQIFGANGELLQNGVASESTTFTLAVTTTGVYAIVIEDTLGTSGGYTLRILPM